MVSVSQIVGIAGSPLFAVEHSAEPVLEQLDGPRRAAVIMALLGLTLVGMFLIAFVMIGGHWVRRLARQRAGVRQLRKPAVAQGNLQEALQTIQPDVKNGDTVLLNPASKETRVD